jgi:glycolate oxidase iron-sulfur subunit
MAFPEDGAVTSDPASPPTGPSLQALTDRCVQCGLCLPVCPTYALEPLETESPRGRIALAKAWDKGLLETSETGDRHLDQCLGCRRCEAVCPAGVEYGAILTAARAQQRERRVPGWRQRAAERLAVDTRLRRGVFRLYRQLWPVLPAKLRPLPRPLTAMSPTKRPRPASGQSVGTDEKAYLAVFVGCFAEQYEAPARSALDQLLKAIGVEAAYPPQPACCGALHAHAGDHDTAARLAHEAQRAFAQFETVLSLASGCHDALAGRLAGETSETRVIDALAFLARHGDTLRFASHRERIALHLPCTQRNVVKSDGALRALLARVPQLEVVELDAGFGCCGAAGTQMLTDPERAARFRQPLLDQFAASGATRLLSANIGCRLHLGNSTAQPVEHPLEFLAQCLA